MCISMRGPQSQLRGQGEGTKSLTKIFGGVGMVVGYLGHPNRAVNGEKWWKWRWYYSVYVRSYISKNSSLEKRRPRASNGQRYPLPCRTHFGNLKCAQQGKGYCWPVLALGRLFSIVKFMQGSGRQGSGRVRYPIEQRGEFPSIRGGQGLSKGRWGLGEEGVAGGLGQGGWG